MAQSVGVFLKSVIKMYYQAYRSIKPRIKRFKMHLTFLNFAVMG